jgi:anti-sigma factor RsiW
MTCEQVQELIHAYIDGELDLLRNMEMDGHLGECEMCRSEHQDYSYLRTLVQRGAHYFAVSQDLKKRIEKQVSSQTGNASCL